MNNFLPEEDLPRQKLFFKGCAALTDVELLSIVLNTGNKEKSALQLATELLRLSQYNLNEFGKLSLNDLQVVKGVGASKAALIIAALELGRRRQFSSLLQRTQVKSSNDIAEYLRIQMKDSSVELFGIIYLNRANRIQSFEIISRGGITGTVADPRVILKRALEERATQIVLAHNHPSGNIKPSRADEEITQKIKMAASFLDIRVLDHIIVSDEGFFSFADEGMI